MANRRQSSPRSGVSCSVTPATERAPLASWRRPQRPESEGGPPGSAPSSSRSRHAARCVSSSSRFRSSSSSSSYPTSTWRSGDGRALPERDPDGATSGGGSSSGKASASVGIGRTVLGGELRLPPMPNSSAMTWSYMHLVFGRQRFYAASSAGKVTRVPAAASEEEALVGHHASLHSARADHARSMRDEWRSRLDELTNDTKVVKTTRKEGSFGSRVEKVVAVLTFPDGTT